MCAVREGAQFYAPQRGVRVGSAVCTVQSGVRGAAWLARRVGGRNFRAATRSVHGAAQYVQRRAA